VVERTLSGAAPLALVASGPLPMHTPPCAWQCLARAQTEDCWQSADVAAIHAPSLSEQAPSSLQRADFRQAALFEATHVPPLASHLPELAQTPDFAQSCGVATHTPSLAAQRASSLQAMERAQSSLDVAVQRPLSALHRPCVAHGLVASGFASSVPAQCRRESAAHLPPDITHSPSVSHRVTHSAWTELARSTQLPRYASQVFCFWQSCELLQSASLVAVQAPCAKLHRP